MKRIKAGWITGPEGAAQFIAAVAWPWEREENRDRWAPKMLTDSDLLKQEYARAKSRLDAAFRAATPTPCPTCGGAGIVDTSPPGVEGSAP